MEYVCITNWAKFQHYGNRNPPWIKLYTHLLEDYQFSLLPDASKLLAFYLILLAARTDNKTPLDPKWVQSRANISQLPDFTPLINMGFLYKHDASTMLLAPKRREEEKDIKKERNAQKGDFRNRSLKAEALNAIKRVPK